MSGLEIGLISVWLFVFGATVGSFLNVCVYRLPKATGLWNGLRSLSSPPSTCPKCRTRIRSRDNVPILGWLLLGGRCRTCGLKIAVRYPFVELMNGLLWVGLYWLHRGSSPWPAIERSWLATPYGPEAGEHPFFSPWWWIHARFAYHVLLAELLVVAGLIDFDTKTIPKLVTDPFILVGVVLAGLGGLYLLPVAIHPPGFVEDARLLTAALTSRELPSGLAALFPDDLRPQWIDGFPGSQLHGLAVSFAGVVAGVVPLLFLRVTGRWIYGREAMGSGDVYLMALIGAFLGWQAALATIVLAALIATASFVLILLFGARAEVPFGPYLALGAATVVGGWPWLWPRVEAVAGFGPLLLPLLVALAMAFVVVAYATRLLLHPLLCRLPGYREQWEAEPPGEWTAADQNLFFANSRIDEERGLAERPDWFGPSVSSGFQGEQSWRDD